MNKELRGGLAWAVGLVTVALVAVFARKLGYIEGDTVTRVCIGMNGLLIASYGNRMPKAVFPTAWARQMNRVAGWSMVMSGLLYMGLWAFAPISVAMWAGCGVILAWVVVTLGYGVSLRRKAKTA